MSGYKEQKIQIFTILLKEKCLASFDLNLEAIVTSGTCEIGSYIVVYTNIIKATEKYSTISIPFPRNLHLNNLIN